MVAVAGRDGVRVRPQSIDEIRDLLSWREGLLVFRGTPLVEAVAEFNRYNAQKLVVDDPSIAAIPVGGSFRWATIGRASCRERGSPYVATTVGTAPLKKKKP